MAEFFETLMLICFVCSWPINIRKAYKAGTTKGMSLPFTILIMTGYVAGIIAKIIRLHSGVWSTFSFYVYIINLLVVSCNIFVYIRNLRLDRENGVK